MEEELKDLLSSIKGQEDIRRQGIDELNAQADRLKIREQDEVERFENGMREDIGNGLYNNHTDGYMQRIIDKEVALIREKYVSQNEELSQKLSEARIEGIRAREADYSKITSEVNHYYVNLILKSVNAKNEYEKFKSEKTPVIKEIEQKIADLDAERTHLVMKNRELTDEGINLRIAAIQQDIDTLQSEKGQIEQGLIEQWQNIEKLEAQKQKVGKFITQTRLSEKSIDEIYQMLFDEELKRVERKSEPESEPEANNEEPEPEFTPEEPSEATKPEPEATPELEVNNEEPEPEPAPEEPEVTKPEPEAIPEPETIEITKPQPEPTPEPETLKIKKTNSEKSNEFITYKFSAEGIEYGGRDINPRSLLKKYEGVKYDVDIYLIVKKAIGEENAQDFIGNADRFLYLSIIDSDLAQDATDGKIEVNGKALEGIREYYKIWSSPRSQEKSKMRIIYDMKKVQPFSGFFKPKDFLYEDEIKNMKANAFEMRHNSNVTIDNLNFFDKIKYKLADVLENAKTKLLLKEPEENVEDGEYENVEEETSGSKAESFRKSMEAKIVLGTPKVSSREEKAKEKHEDER